jgi:hypothetical protein
MNDSARTLSIISSRFRGITLRTVASDWFNSYTASIFTSEQNTSEVFEDRQLASLSRGNCSVVTAPFLSQLHTKRGD